jgi:hypothetical protein
VVEDRGQLTPEERAKITKLQDALIDRFIRHSEAISDGEESRAKELEAEMDKLLRETEKIKNSA